MSDLENELLGLAEDNPVRKSRKRDTVASSRKSKSYNDDESDEGEEMDMDLESEEGDDRPAARSNVTGSSSKKSLQNPYPLEGKYIDEDDRDHLESLPEIERENILANRLEEVQRFKDAAQLDAMYKMAGMGDGDVAEDDEGPSRKRRRHVPTETSRAMAELKNRRKQKDERVQRRAARRERRAHDASSHEESSEEGEISDRETFRPMSPLRKRRSPERPIKSKTREEPDMDATPPDRQELNSARLSRYELVDMMFKDEFEDVIKGAYVRLMAEGQDENGRPKYRIYLIKGIEEKAGQYPIEYKGRTVSDNRGLVCSYGSGTSTFRIADVSNGDFEDSEFSRFSMTCAHDKVAMPRRSELKRKHEEIKALRERPMTEGEINRQIEQRKKANPQAQRQQLVYQVSQLMTSRSLAIRRNDAAAIEDLNKQIAELGADPLTGQLPVEIVTPDVSDYDSRIQKINENNKRKTKEAMIRAHEAALARKKAQDAIIKAKAQAAAAAATKGDAVEVTPAKLKVPSLAGLRKGETPQQFVARTIELDLGDF